MADERAAEQPDGGASETAVSQPHDKYFYGVFSNEQDAASLLRTCVPRSLADTLKWSTLTRQSGRFVEYEREFAELVTDAASEWRWVPRFEHLLIDQTELGAESVPAAGTGGGRGSGAGVADRDDGDVSGSAG